MFCLKLISHQDLTLINLKEVISVKSVAWLFSFEEQVNWMQHNLKGSDIHALLYCDNILASYLNMVEIEFNIDGIMTKGIGIGNVCTRERGKGWGKELLIQTNDYLTYHNKIGLLFCKVNLVKFYQLNQWMLIEKTKLDLSIPNDAIETMIFNSNKVFQKLSYSGRSF